MNITKFVFKSHKWLAVATSVLTILWFFSGIFMTTPQFIQQAFAESPAPSADPATDVYRDVRISIPEAVALVDKNAESPVRVDDVSIRRIGGKLYYRVATNQGSNLINVIDGSFLKITEDVARQLVLHSGAQAETLGTATLMTRWDGLYTWASLPAWKMRASDKAGTIYYVSTDTGEVSAYGGMKKLRAHLVGMHSLEFLNPWMTKAKIRFLMWIFTLVGNVMIFFGMWILWIQYKNWRERRAA